MATKIWLGDGGANLFNVGANWKDASSGTTGVVPGASDVALFNSDAAGRECNFDLATGSSITIGEIIIESDYGGSLRLQTVPVTKAVYLGKAGGIRVDSASSIDFRQGSSGSEYGSYKSFNNRFLMITDDGSWSGSITLNMYGGSVVTKFDDGDHATTVLKTGSFAPNYVAPTGTSGKTTFTAFTADNGITFEPTGNLVENDRLKHFVFNTFTYSDDLFNAGAATCEFKATSSGIYLPITGAESYGQNPSGNPSDFVSYMRKVILTADTAGHKILMRDNSYVSLEELEIGDGVMFKGPMSLNAQGSDIRLVNAPKIRGSWSFSQISQGVYRSPRHASGPMPKIQGSLEITSKLTVGGLIDPTGLVIDEKPSVSDTGHTTVTGKGLLWVKTGSPNELYFTNEDGDDVQITSGSSIAGGGGGGSYSDANAIAAVEGESTLTLSSGVTVGTDLKMTTSSDHAIIENVTQDKDIIFKVNDGGSTTEVMRIDGSKSYVTIGGVTSANAMLHLQSSTSAQPEVRLENTNADNQEACIRFMKNTASPAASDDIGLIRFEGENSAGSNHLYGYILGQMIDPTDTQESGEIIFYIGHKGSQLRVLDITGSNTGTGEIVINEGGNNDFNFRVESDNDTHMLFVDSADDRVGIGTNNPASTLHVDGTIRQTNATSAVLVADSNGDLSAASNLQDLAYIQSGSAGADPYTPLNPANWAGAPPTSLLQAIQRLEGAVAGLLGGTIP